jgi:hypothetical protein
MNFEGMAAWQAWALRGRHGGRGGRAVSREAARATHACGLAHAVAAGARRPARAHAVGAHSPRRVTGRDGGHRAAPGARDRAAGARRRRHGTGAGRLLIVIDSATSMQASTSSGETRWERALAEARRIATGAGGRELAARHDGRRPRRGAHAGCLGDRSRARPAAAGRADRTAWPHVADTAATHFITDGATARTLDRSVIVHSVFESAPNAAILAFDVRPALTAAHAGEAYIEIANFARARRPSSSRSCVGHPRSSTRRWSSPREPSCGRWCPSRAAANLRCAHGSAPKQTRLPSMTRRSPGSIGRALSPSPWWAATSAGSSARSATTRT